MRKKKFESLKALEGGRSNRGTSGETTGKASGQQRRAQPYGETDFDTLKKELEKKRKSC